ncbi:internalin, partial [Erysipelothrix rhusiopathiae]|nr:internalin [Erysipelothrix rhusiopathiae]
VTYKDGIQDENSFKDQVYQELEKGSATPKYVGNLSRVGYQFKGWSPSISETVTEDAIYVAQWKKIGVVTEEKEKLPPTGVSNRALVEIGIGILFIAAIPLLISFRQKRVKL